MNQTVKILARVDLTEGRKADLSGRMSRMVLSINELEEDKKRYAAEANAEIKTIEADLRDLALIVRQGYEERNVECYSVEDWPRRTRRFYSVETHELIDTKPISPEEAQRELFEGHIKEPAGDYRKQPWLSKIPYRTVVSWPFGLTLGDLYREPTLAAA